MNTGIKKRLTASIATIACVGLVTGCTVAPPKPPAPKGTTATLNAVNGRLPLVAPGEKDEELAFFSGGPSGSVQVVGVPSMRVLKEIPVFEARAAYGYGYDPTTREMLQSTMPDPNTPSWGDTHHPMMSKTDGNYDGKALYINDLANSRIAKIDLKTFKTVKIRRIPHIQGVHGIGVDPNTKYIFATGEWEIPNVFSKDASDTNKQFKTGITVMDKDLNILAQVPLPYGNTDIMGTTFDGHYVFTTIYNTENGLTMKDMVTADKDLAAFLDIHKIESALSEGKFTTVDGIKVINMDYPGLTTYVPVPKNPHGIDPDPSGKYVTVAGKLSPTVSVIDLATLKVVGEAQVGAGPLHTAFDGKGNAYTALFLDSAVVKWNIAEVVAGKPKETYIKDQAAAHYSPGHISIDGSGSKSPIGKWMIAPDKFSQDQYVNVGTDFPINEELYDISGDKMRLVAEMPIAPEPHDLVMVPASLFKDIPQVTKPEDTMDMMDMNGNKDPNMTPTAEGKTTVTRDGNHVTVHTTAKRSEYGFQEIHVKQGDLVTMYITSLETHADITHGFALPDYGINVPITAGETVKVEFKADKPGTFWAYCTWFCSALHLEMRSRIIVDPQ